MWAAVQLCSGIFLSHEKMTRDSLHDMQLGWFKNSAESNMFTQQFYFTNLGGLGYEELSHFTVCICGLLEFVTIKASFIMKKNPSR